MTTSQQLAVKAEQHQDNSNIDAKLAASCEELLGKCVVAMEYPGGNSRESVKIITDDGLQAFASTRSRSARANNERRVLIALAEADVNTPRLLASDTKRLLIQECIPGGRLTESLYEQEDSMIELRMHNALESLSNIQQAGSAAGLDQAMDPLGNTDGWLDMVLQRPEIIGDFFNIAAPDYNKSILKDVVRARQPRFVKWDARPGNAITRPDNQVFWIDWEHSGARNRLDDMVWLLADEWVPERPRIEQRLLDAHIHRFSDDLSIDEARRYFYAMGVFHLCVRMGLIFRYKKDGKWWNYEKCLAADKVGVTRRNLRRICMRGERWAAKNPETKALSAWFSKMRTLADK